MGNSTQLLVAIIDLLSQLSRVAPQVIEAGRLALLLLQSNASPTPAQHNQIDTALVAAHRDLQDEIDKRLR